MLHDQQVVWEACSGLSLLCVIERLSSECRKTKTKVITTANQKKGSTLKSQSELNVKTSKPSKARETDAGDQVVTGDNDELEEC